MTKIKIDMVIHDNFVMLLWETNARADDRELLGWEISHREA